MKKNSILILYLKVFCILLVVGFILPNLIVLLIDKVIILNDKMPSGNSVYVMYSEDFKRSWYGVLKDLFGRIINF